MAGNTAEVVELKENGVDMSVLDPGRARQGLSPKQEKLAQNLFKGMKHLDAYQDAYDTYSETKANLYANSSAAANHPKVRARVAQLQQRADQQTYDDAEDLADFIVREIKAIAGDPKQQPKDRLKALEMLGKTRQVMLFKEVIVTENDTRTPEEMLEDIKRELGKSDS